VAHGANRKPSDEENACQIDEANPALPLSEEGRSDQIEEVDSRRLLVRGVSERDIPVEPAPADVGVRRLVAAERIPERGEREEDRQGDKREIQPWDPLPQP
jgi:hypothetical protein